MPPQPANLLQYETFDRRNHTAAWRTVLFRILCIIGLAVVLVALFASIYTFSTFHNLW